MPAAPLRLEQRSSGYAQGFETRSVAKEVIRFSVAQYHNSLIKHKSRLTGLAFVVVVFGLIFGFLQFASSDPSNLTAVVQIENISKRIVGAPGFRDQAEKEVYWSQLHLEAQQASRLARLEDVKSPGPAGRELKWAAELLPKAVLEASTGLRSTPTHKRLLLHLGYARKMVEDWEAKRRQDPLGLHSALESQMLFYSLLVLNAIVLSWIAKLQLVRPR